MDGTQEILFLHYPLQRLYLGNGKDLQRHCYEELATISPSLSILVPTDTLHHQIFSKSSYSYFYLTNAFFVNLGSQLVHMLESPRVASNAPTVQQGLSLETSADIDGWDMLRAMILNCIPHLGIIVPQPQTLIDTLTLINRDDIYDFLHRSIDTENTIIGRTHATISKCPLCSSHFLAN